MMAFGGWFWRGAVAWICIFRVANQAVAVNDEYSTTTESPVPLIDIAPFVNPSAQRDERLAVAHQIGQACEESGFFAIVNHGVDNSVISEAWNVTEQFFDLPMAEKQKSASTNDVEYPYGYEQSESLSKGRALESSSDSIESPPDLKETYAMGPDNAASGMPPRRFPPNPPEMKVAYERYYSAMEDLATVLLEAFAMALSLPDGWFEDKMDHHMCALRALNYPSLDEIAPLPGQLRAGAHTDYGALTILKSGGSGLQLTKENIIEQNWVDVPYLKDAFIINIGDLMQRWTNNKWVSTLHRVVVPPENSGKNRRQSIAFFVNINGDADVVPIETCVDEDNPPRYGSITAGEHLMSKHLASMGINTDDVGGEL